MASKSPGWTRKAVRGVDTLLSIIVKIVIIIRVLKGRSE